MLVVPSDLHYTYGETTLVGTVRDPDPETAVAGQAPAAGPAGPDRGVRGKAVHAGRPVRHLLALRGALSRRGTGGGVHVRRPVRDLLEDGLALLRPPPGDHGGDRRVRDAASVHDHLDAGQLHPPGAPGRRWPWRSSSLGAVLCRAPDAGGAGPSGRDRGRGRRAPEARPMWPNLFLVGAAKAGTTSVYDELARHPAIYMSPIKEPHFFSRIEPSPRAGGLLPSRQRPGRVPGPVRSRRPTEQLVGEASTSYLWDGHAAERIERVAPEASILIMLRDPVERAYSQYWNDVREGLERRPFPEALAEERAVGTGCVGGHLPVHRLRAVRGPGGALPGPVRRAGPGSFFEDFVADQPGTIAEHPLVPRGRVRATAAGRAGRTPPRCPGT